MLTLPLITPRDSHELWFGSSSQSHRTLSTPTSQNQPPNALTNQSQPHLRHNGNTSTAATTTHGPGSLNRPSTGESLSALQFEERALRARKHNIASFGYAWIKPAGCPKTMLGMKEEEAEREEALAAAQQEMAAAAAAAAAAETGGVEGATGQEGAEEEGMERDLDDDIPDADVHADAEEDEDEDEGEEGDGDGDGDDVDGLVEEGEEGLGEDDLVDEEGFMERDLDDDIPEAYPDDDEEEDDEEVYDNAQYEDFDNQPDLDAEVPVAGDGAGDNYDEHDLDDEIPEAEAAEDFYNQEEWQHTDTEAEFDDDDDDDDNQSLSLGPNSLRNSLASAPRSSGLPPGLPSVRRNRRSRGLGDARETEAQRRFLQRWSGGGDAFDSSMLADEEEDLRASTTSQSSRRSIFGRFARRNGGPRDSLD